VGGIGGILVAVTPEPTAPTPEVAEVKFTCGIPVGDGPYTLGNEGAVPEIGLISPPVSPPIVEVGESGGAIPEFDSVIFESEYVRSSD